MSTTRLSEGSPAATLRSKLDRLGIDLVARAFDFSDLPPPALHGFCNDRLLLASFEKITIDDRATEALFTRVRGGLLRLVAFDKPRAGTAGNGRTARIALAQQCFLNEYVWDVTRRRA